MNGAFHALQEIDAHEALNAEFASLAKLLAFLFVQILRELTGMDEFRRRVYGQVQLGEQLEYFLVVDGIRECGQHGTEGDGLVSSGKIPNIRHIVVFLYMLARASDGHAVQNFKEIEVQPFQKICRCSLFFRQLAPGVVDLLSLAEHRVNICLCLELFIELCRISLIGQGQLVAKVIKTIVDGSGREHQHLGPDPGLDDSVHEPSIAVFPAVFQLMRSLARAVSEVMTFVDHHQVIVSPVDTVNRKSDHGVAAVPRQIGMVENIVAQTVLGQRIIDKIAAIGEPIFCKLLGAEHQYIFVAFLIVFDDRERGEGLAETDTVRQYTATVHFQLVDDGKRSIFLEIVQFSPYNAVFKSRGIIREHILRNILQKLTEYVV